MNEIKIFTNSEFGQLQVVDQGGEPWFIGKEVAEMLGYSNTRDALLKHVDDEDKNTVAIRDTLAGPIAGNPNKVIINESGVYSLILRSHLPGAKRFKRWVTHDVIPTIRKHGIYATPETVEDFLRDPDSLIKILQTLKDEREARKQAENKIRLDAPKVLFADSVAQADNEILIGELAKLLRQNGYETGQNRLFNQLREDGFIMKGNTRPTQKGMEMGLFRVIERSITQPDGVTRITLTTKVTGKGQIYFVNRYARRDD